MFQLSGVHCRVVGLWASGDLQLGTFRWLGEREDLRVYREMQGVIRAGFIWTVRRH